MTRVLMVVDGLWNGGAERQLALLAASLPEPWSVMVLSMKDGPYRPVLEALGIDVRVADRRFRFDATPAIRMWRVASEFKPDIVHSWGWMSSAAMVPFCRWSAVPLLDGTIRQGCVPPRRARARLATIALADHVVANSKAGLRAFGVPENRGRVIYNGFDESRLTGLSRDRVPPDENKTIVVMAARMFPAKDWRCFLTAAALLAEADEGGWHFIAVGDGPDRDTLMAASAELVATGVLSFPPGGVEVLPLIAAADVGVLLTDPRSAAEGCSNSIMEYMACGLPVICTDSGGNPELVVEGVTGRLVPPSEVDALAAVLQCLHDEPDTAREMGDVGRLRLHERFSASALASNYVSLYEDILRAGDVKS